jgi:hypothetical protein
VRRQVLSAVPTPGSANTGSASTVRNHGGDRAVFHVTMDEIVINAEDVLVWREANVSGVEVGTWVGTQWVDDSQ